MIRETKIIKVGEFGYLLQYYMNFPEFNNRIQTKGRRIDNSWMDGSDFFDTKEEAERVASKWLKAIY